MKTKVAELMKAGKRNQEIAETLGISKELVCYYKKKAGYVKVKKTYPIGKTEARLERTGLSREQLTAAISRFIRKRENSKYTRHEFTIAFDDVVWNKVCPIFGIELDYFAEVRAPNSVSFDRIDSSKGYVPGNVQIISWRANNLKSNGTVAEFEMILSFLKKVCS